MKFRSFFLFLILFFFIFDISLFAQTSLNQLTLLTVVQDTLKHNITIKKQREIIESKKGYLQNIQGSFDFNLSSSFSYQKSYTPLVSSLEATYQSDRSITEAKNYQLSLSKYFETGTTTLLSWNLLRTDFGYQDPLSVASPENRSNITFKISQALLKGFGPDVVCANQRYSQSDLSASELELQQLINTVLQAEVGYYWDAVAQLNELDIFRSSELRAKKLIDDTEKLTDANLIPKSELTQLHANYKDKLSDTAGQEKTFFLAKQTLGFSMGLSYANILTLPHPTDQFSLLDLDHISVSLNVEDYIQMALSNRPDYLAAQKRITGTQHLIRYYENSLLPDLSVYVSTGYSGLQEGADISHYVTSVTSHLKAPNFGCGINFSYAFEQNANMGLLKVTQSQDQYNQLLLLDFENQIRVDVASALSNLQKSLVEYQHTKTSLGLYELALEHEKNKFQIGQSTLIDIISLEDHLTAEKLELILAQQSIANAIIDLRVKTGTLFYSQTQDTIDLKNLITIPDPKELLK